MKKIVFFILGVVLLGIFFFVWPALSFAAEVSGGLELFLLELIGMYPAISIPLAGLGTLMVLAQIVVPLTPTKKDDAVLNKVLNGIPGKCLRGLTKFALIQKK